MLYHFWSGQKGGRFLRCILRGTSQGLLLQLVAGEEMVRERAFDTIHRVFEWQDAWMDELVAQGWEVV